MPIPKIVSVAIPLTFLLFTGINSCKSPTEPCTDCPQQPDTTSSDFVFEQKEFGHGGPTSWFNDVWIFDENNIWAVGYIDFSKDSVPTNIYRWNGIKWYPYLSSKTSDGISGVWALNSNAVYLAAGGLLKCTNDQLTIIDLGFSRLPGQRLTRIWGTSESNIWAVGSKGIVVHYNGTKWEKVDVGALVGKDLSTINFHSIKGESENHFWLCGDDLSGGTAATLIEHEDGKWNLLFWGEGEQFKLFEDAEWMKSKNNFWVTGGGSIGKYENGLFEDVLFITPGPSYLVQLSRQSDNDFSGCGEYGEIVHFNGKRWKIWKHDQDIHFYNLKQKNDLLIAAGIKNGKAIILMGKR